jgi:protein kinase A
MHRLLHPRRSREENGSNEHQRPDSAATERVREEEKQHLMQWEEQKHPLDPAQIEHQDQKLVGQSSGVLRQKDFELIKTLGTGAQTPR